MTQVATNSDITYDTGSSTLSATQFSGTLLGNATGLQGTPNITVQDITAQTISVGGTLTCAEIGDINAVGSITANNGINVTGILTTNNLDVTSTSTFSDKVTIGTPGIGITLYESGNADFDGDVSITGSLAVNGNNYPTDGALSNRNMIINGEMKVAQRQAFQTITTSTQIYPCVDRFKIELGSQTSPDYTYSQDTDAPPEFTKSFKITNNSPDTQSTATTRYNLVGQILEQANTDGLCWGTSAAKPATISFWIKSNVTGNNIVELIVRRNGTIANESIAGQIVIDSADTWEYKTITIPATTRNIGRPADNNLGFAVYFSYEGVVNTNTLSSYLTWDANNRLGGPAGSTNIFATTSGAYMNITGVQLEVGTKATPFEYVSYDQTLERCFRYYQNIIVNGGSYSGVYWTPGTDTFYGTWTSLINQMRTDPTGSFGGVLQNSFYWVNPGQRSYSSESTAGITIVSNKYGWLLSQVKQGSGSSNPSAGTVYILEAKFFLSLNSEL
jgi:hypothetical protein